jgi:hypothetical protein
MERRPATRRGSSLPPAAKVFATEDVDAPPMGDLDAFATTKFLGRGTLVVQDPERLAHFAKHLEEEERVLAVLPLRKGQLFVTDRRLIEFQPHLEVHGAWNVLRFVGFQPLRSVPLERLASVERRLGEERRVRGRPIRAEEIHVRTTDRTYVWDAEPFDVGAMTPQAIDRFVEILKDAARAASSG